MAKDPIKKAGAKKLPRKRCEEDRLRRLLPRRLL